MPATIIFGPTGHVGSAVALSAHAYGADKVILAMRDPTKPIPGLTPHLESTHAFQRVQADLGNPESVKAAVIQTGATRAFVYIVHGAKDHMRGAIEALKAGGVEFVVFLSTGGMKGDVRALQPSSLIAWLHAQVEITLEEVFGKEGFVALRPGFFASNAVGWWKGMIPKGEVKVYAGDLEVDWIAPADIGRVAAAVLGKGLGVEWGAVNLLGPKNVSLRDGVGVIARAAGKEVRVVDVDAEEGVRLFVESGVPPPVASQLIEYFREGLENGEGVKEYLGERYEEAVANVPKYTGRPATTLEEWAEENKHEFAG